MKAYLLVFEIDPMQVGKTYASLPLHCTLVNWFWSPVAANELVAALEPIISKSLPVTLHSRGVETFTGFTKIGTIPVTVNTVVPTEDIVTLHSLTCKQLDSLSCTYMKPEFVKAGYRPHATQHHASKLESGTSVNSVTVYLISADAPEYGNDRTVVYRFTSLPAK